MSTLAVILCNYNHSAYISRAIEAMLTQSRPPDQLIIVDDGSTDDSVQVIESWASKSPSILFLKNERNLGFHASWNRAMAGATTHYLYSAAADDYILPGFFENVCGLMDQHPQAGVGCAKMVKQRVDGTRIASDGFRSFSEPTWISPEDFLTHCLEAEPATHSLSAATIYRRDALLKVGGWPKELGPWADTFSIRAIGLESGICYVPQEGTVCTVHETGMSQTWLRDPRATLAMLRNAAARMRSPEFASTFPEDHIRRWEAQYFDSLVYQQLQPGFQAIFAKGDRSQTPRRSVFQLPHQIVRYSAGVGYVIYSFGVVRSSLTICKLGAGYIRRRLGKTNYAREDSNPRPTD